MVKYELIYDDEIYLNWIGKYTYGSCTMRGTCLHFQPSSAKFFHELTENTEIMNSFNEECNKYVDKDKNISKRGIFLIECCSYRCTNLDEAIKDLTIKPIEEISRIFNNKKNCENIFEPYCKDINLLYNPYINYYNEYKDEILKSEGFCDLDDKIIYFFKYNQIINELQKILQYANNNNVFQEWI